MWFGLEGRSTPAGKTRATLDSAGMGAPPAQFVPSDQEVEVAPLQMWRPASACGASEKPSAAAAEATGTGWRMRVSCLPFSTAYSQRRSLDSSRGPDEDSDRRPDAGAHPRDPRPRRTAKEDGGSIPRRFARAEARARAAHCPEGAER